MLYAAILNYKLFFKHKIDKMEYKDNSLEHENKRKWLNAWVGVASAFNCQTTDAATRWADCALKDFDTRFPKPKEVLAPLPFPSDRIEGGSNG